LLNIAKEIVIPVLKLVVPIELFADFLIAKINEPVAQIRRLCIGRILC